MADANNADEPVVHGLSGKLPDFEDDDPRAWFLRLDAIFRTSRITRDATKFDYAFAKLTNKIASACAHIAEDEAATDKYAQLRAALCGQYGRTPYQAYEAIDKTPGLCGRKPSVFLAEILSTLPDAERQRPSGMVIYHFLKHLPPDTRAAIEWEDKSPQQIADAADKHWANRGSSADTNAVGPNRGGRKRSPNRQRQRRSGTPAASDLCYYHRMYGTKARKCRPPCKYEPESENEVAADSE